MTFPFLDRCIFQAAAGGTADFVEVAAATGFQTMAAAGVINGQTLHYAAQATDLSQWEVGSGTYSSVGPTLVRDTVFYNSLGTTAKINFAAAPQVLITVLKMDFGQPFATADTTYYVSTTGNDATNDGLSALTPFRTIQHAMDIIALFYWNGFQPSIEVADGTYIEDLVLPVLIGVVLQSNRTWDSVVVDGNAASPGNVILQGTGTSNYIIEAQGAGCKWYFKNMTLFQAGTQSFGSGTAGAFLEFQNIIFDGSATPNNGIGTGNFSAVVFPYGGDPAGEPYDCTINVGCNNNFFTGGSQAIIDFEVATLTIGPGVNWGGYMVVAILDGVALFYYDALVGTATGPRFLSATGSGIETFGGGLNYIPGNVAGTADAATYGWYE